MSSTTFKYASYSAQSADLIKKTKSMLEGSQSEKILLLLSDLPPLPGNRDDRQPLTLAFIGQYNAGKSTIVKALTGREDILG